MGKLLTILGAATTLIAPASVRRRTKPPTDDACRLLLVLLLPVFISSYPCPSIPNDNRTILTPTGELVPSAHPQRQASQARPPLPSLRPAGSWSECGWITARTETSYLVILKSTLAGLTPPTHLLAITNTLPFESVSVVVPSGIPKLEPPKRRRYIGSQESDAVAGKVTWEMSDKS